MYLLHLAIFLKIMSFALNPIPTEPISSTFRESMKLSTTQPYAWDDNQYRNYKNQLVAFRATQGLPAVFLDADISVHPNIFATPDTLATQTIDLGTGTFTFWFEAGSGSVVSSNGTGAATGHATAIAGRNNKVTITVTTAGTFTFTVTGTVQRAQLEHGSFPTNYQTRTTGVLPVINLGSTSTSGDGTFAATTGTTGRAYQVTVVNNEKRFRFASANTQRIALSTPTIATGGACTYIVQVTPRTTVTGSKTLVGGSGAGAPVLRLQSGIPQIQIGGTATILTGSNIFTVNTTYLVALTRTSAGVWTLYSNFGGSFVTEGTVTDARALTARTVLLGSDQNLNGFDGEMQRMYINTSLALSAIEVQQIFSAFQDSPVAALNPTFIRGTGTDTSVQPLFIMAGQSNSLGVSPTSELPADLARANFPNALTYDALKLVVEPLQVGPTMAVNNNQNTTTGGDYGNRFFGPELAFAKTMLNRYEKIGLIKYSVGETGLSQVANPNWNTASTGTNSLYNNLFNSFYTPSLPKFAAVFPASDVRAFIWIQGENDAVAGQTTSQYETNLTALVNAVRTSTSKPSLPFIIVRLGWRNDSVGNTNDTNIRNAQTNVANAMTNVRIVEVDDLTKFDGVHYSAPSMITLGDRIAQTYITNFA